MADLTATPEFFGDEPDYDQDPAPIPGELEAVRMGRWLRKVVDDTAGVDQLAADARDEIDRWHAEERAKLDRRRVWIETRLIAWHEAVYEATGRKSINLPTVRCTSRQSQPWVEWVDTEAALDWLIDAAPDLVRVRHEIDKAAAKAAFTVADDHLVDANGEVVPGAVVHPARRSFSVAPS